MEQANTRHRRAHSARLKAEVVAACAAPGASVAAIALARGLNTNLVHKWRRQARRAAAASLSVLPEAPKAAGAEFIALPMPVAAAPEPAADIRIEVHRGATRIAVHWPASAASECAAWLGQWLR